MLKNERCNRWSLSGLSLVIAVVLMVSAGFCKAEETDGLLVKSGDSIAFMGDSITQFGWGKSNGYVRLIMSCLKTNGLEITPVPAGISGHKSDQMLERLERDVISKKPTWMTLSCGVNDVMHGARGIELEPYKKNIREIVEKTQAAGIKVMILTATMISEDPQDSRNVKLADYNIFLRELAKEKGCPLADLNADMQKMIAETPEKIRKHGRALTVDGVHMSPIGDEMMAKGVLRTFGLTVEQIDKATDEWNKASSGQQAFIDISLADYKKLVEKSAAQDTTPRDLLNKISTEAFQELIK